MLHRHTDLLRTDLEGFCYVDGKWIVPEVPGTDAVV